MRFLCLERVYHSFLWKLGARPKTTGVSQPGWIPSVRRTSKPCGVQTEPWCTEIGNLGTWRAKRVQQIRAIRTKAKHAGVPQTVAQLQFMNCFLRWQLFCNDLGGMLVCHWHKWWKPGIFPWASQLLHEHLLQLAFQELPRAACFSNRFNAEANYNPAAAWSCGVISSDPNRFHGMLTAATEKSCEAPWGLVGLSMVKLGKRWFCRSRWRHWHWDLIVFGTQIEPRIETEPCTANIISKHVYGHMLIILRKSLHRHRYDFTILPGHARPHGAIFSQWWLWICSAPW